MDPDPMVEGLGFGASGAGNPTIVQLKNSPLGPCQSPRTISDKFSRRIGLCRNVS